MTEPAARPAFPLELQLWLAPTFPVGSFAYSHGLEWAVSAGLIHDRASSVDWLGDLLGHGSARSDALLLAAAWRAADGRNAPRLLEVNALALALAGSRERHLETVTQGNAFVATLRAAWCAGEPDRLALLPAGCVAYPVAVGACAAASDISLGPTLQAYIAAVISNLVSALVRLSAIGQTDGQRVLSELAPHMRDCARQAATATLDDLGGATFLSDIAAMRHETLETRMFRS